MITWKPTGFYSRVNTRDCFSFRELKYKVVNATKVVGEHSHPNLRPPGTLLPSGVERAIFKHGPEGLA